MNVTAFDVMDQAQTLQALQWLDQGVRLISIAERLGRTEENMVEHLGRLVLSSRAAVAGRRMLLRAKMSTGEFSSRPGSHAPVYEVDCGPDEIRGRSLQRPVFNGHDVAYVGGAK